MLRRGFANRRGPQAAADNATVPGSADQGMVLAARRPESADLVGLLAVVGAGLLPVVFADDLYFRSWAPKAALCLVLLGPGVVLLVFMAVAGNRAAILAATFLGLACLSTALSDKPTLSLVGAANWGTGLLFVATLTGSWALGAVAGERRRRQFVVAIIAAVVVNAVVAWLQARGLAPEGMTDLRAGLAGRAGGLTGNPVHLGALTAGALLLLGHRVGSGRGSWWWLPAVALVAGAAQLSGGRAAVALAAVSVLACLPAAGLRRGAAVVGAVLVGVALAPAGSEGAVLGSARAAQPVAGPAVARTDTRFAVWRISVPAILVDAGVIP